MLCALALICISKTCEAESRDDIVNRDSNRCTRYFSYYETKYQIPNHLLHAVALKESGIYHHTTKRTHPWPWTINYKGKGYFFESKAAAINAVKKIFSGGDRSVDVGCMQINLLHHKDAFRSLEHAFDPRSNVEYGAKFLSGNFQKSSSWKHAVAAYHSANTPKGVHYSNKVLSIWRKEGKKYEASLKGHDSRITVADSSTDKRVVARRANFNSSSETFNPNPRKKDFFIKVTSESKQAEHNAVAKISSDTVKQFRSN
ncbi:MAG: hypothetical protein BGO27_05135 [Alphaproteobacteria bacterium 33-17]|nr:MAG: hypothetical protein BGO27_05135 [Alphaproteobacteria bacterium 33-17]